MSTTVTTIGHVNVDHVVTLNRPIRSDVTSLVDRRMSEPAGRLGGCAANIAVGLSARGIDTNVVSYVGCDPDGERVLELLEASRVDTSGIERDASRRTGITWMASVPGDESYCIYDEGGPPPTAVNAVQRHLIASAAWLVAAVGPPQPCQVALELISPETQLVWAVKADPESIPSELARELLARANVIVFNDSERQFLKDRLGGGWEHRRRPDALIVETLGAQGAQCRIGERAFLVPTTQSLGVADSVGAGDAFLAGLVAGLIAGDDPERATASGVQSATELLASRHESSIQNTGE